MRMVVLRQLTKREVDFIKNLENSRIRAQLVANPSAEDIRIIRNLCGNLCRGRFHQLNEKQRARLRPHVKVLRDLGDPSVKKCDKRLVAQSGDALGVLMPMLSVLVTEITKQILRRLKPVNG
jgi:hypothetical protein